MNRGWNNFEAHESKSLDCLEQHVGRNMNIKGTSGKGWKENQEHIAGNGRRDNPCYNDRKSGWNVFCGFVESRTYMKSFCTFS